MPGRKSRKRTTRKYSFSKSKKKTGTNCSKRNCRRRTDCKRNCRKRTDCKRNCRKRTKKRNCRKKTKKQNCRKKTKKQNCTKRTDCKQNCTKRTDCKRNCRNCSRKTKKLRRKQKRGGNPFRRKINPISEGDKIGKDEYFAQIDASNAEAAAKRKLELFQNRQEPDPCVVAFYGANKNKKVMGNKLYDTAVKKVELLDHIKKLCNLDKSGDIYSDSEFEGLKSLGKSLGLNENQFVNVAGDIKYKHKASKQLLSFKEAAVLGAHFPPGVETSPQKQEVAEDPQIKNVKEIFSYLTNLYKFSNDELNIPRQLPGEDPLGANVQQLRDNVIKKREEEVIPKLAESIKILRDGNYPSLLKLYNEYLTKPDAELLINYERVKEDHSTPSTGKFPGTNYVFVNPKITAQSFIDKFRKKLQKHQSTLANKIHNEQLVKQFINDGRENDSSFGDSPVSAIDLQRDVTYPFSDDKDPTDHPDLKGFTYQAPTRIEKVSPN